MKSSRGAAWIGVLLLLVLAAGIAAWLFRADIARGLGLGGRAVAATEVSPEAAEQAEEKLHRLRTEGDTARLSEVEFASVLRYRFLDAVPDALRDPAIAFEGDTLRVSAGFPTERLPAHPDLDRVRMFLPDTTRVDISGHLRPLSNGRAAVEVIEVAVAGVPIPSRYYPDMLERMGRRPEPGLPSNGMAVPLPDGVGAAWLEHGFLVLTP